MVIVFAVRGAVGMFSEHTQTKNAPTATSSPAAEEPQSYVFYYKDGQAVNWEDVTDAWAAEAGFQKRYTLTDADDWRSLRCSQPKPEANPSPERSQ